MKTPTKMLGFFIVTFLMKIFSLVDQYITGHIFWYCYAHII